MAYGTTSGRFRVIAAGAVATASHRPRWCGGVRRLTVDPQFSAPAPVPARATAPQLAATGAGSHGAAAALASALVLGGAILYRRSRIA
ncbi:hypothetical protein DRB89_32940 [Streptomyces sp. ICC4]|nr:hypothetical protein DRB89_32940 [Streptomyces sp. ICC4]